MIEFTTTLHQFEEKGEKTGWTYISIPADLAQKLKPGNKKSFRVSGKLDSFSIKQVALIPMGGGSFIMAINADMRRGIGKRKGAMVTVKLTADKTQYQLNKDFMDCLNDEPAAMSFFKTLAGSHQRYFSKWIDSAKTDQTKTKRIAMAVTALAKKLGYGEMIRASQGKI